MNIFDINPVFQFVERTHVMITLVLGMLAGILHIGIAVYERERKFVYKIYKRDSMSGLQYWTLK